VLFQRLTTYRKSGRLLILRDIAIVGAGICRAVVRIVGYVGLDRLYRGVKFSELNVRSVAKVTEHGQASLRRNLQVGDSECGDIADDLGAEGGIYSIEHSLTGVCLEPDQDVTSAYAVWGGAGREGPCAEC
jgi:hypothetical protein